MRAARATNSSTASPTQSTPPAPAPSTAASTRRSSRACAPWPACSSPNATAAASTSASAHMLDIMADTDLSHTHNDSADTPDLSRMSCGCNSPERLRSGLPDASSGWAVVQTHAQAERWAEANIRRIGYPTFLPLCAASVRDRLVRSLHHTVLRPLFPTYLFVNVAGAPIVPVWYAPGVNHMLMNGEKPHMVPEAVFSALQAGEASRRTPPPPE